MTRVERLDIQGCPDAPPRRPACHKSWNILIIKLTMFSQTKLKRKKTKSTLDFSNTFDIVISNIREIP